MTDQKGSVCIVLHTHLPYVNHPEHDDFLEEDWLFEAITETYLPLVFIMNDLWTDKVPFRLTFSMTPPLIHMLRSPILMAKFEKYLDKRIELADLEVKRQAGDRLRLESARHYQLRFGQMREFFHACNGDITAGFRRFAELGLIEIIASAATHGFLPLFESDTAVRAQIALGVELHKDTFGVAPKGFWLPECAYRPGMDALLLEHGIEYTILDTHGLTGAEPTPDTQSFRPIKTRAGLTAFGRDAECSQQIWSSVVGYPGDPDYRELYRDIGYDADYRFIKPFLKQDGVRRNIGMKYHRITGDVPLHEKELYSPSVARERAATHAGNFLFNRGEQIKHQNGILNEPICITAPFDTELFGHWWYEGPWFLEEMFRQAAEIGDEATFDLCTPSEVMAKNETTPTAEIGACSWGEDGFYKVWLNDKNQWFWPHLHQMEERMALLAKRDFPKDSLAARILRQMGRELLLAQSSDWSFILTMETSTWYAEKRFRDHVHRFFALEDLLDESAPNTDLLDTWEKQDAIFPNLDYRLFASQAK
ncbi:MAG: 1,4-alpha-glucan branching enzyme [Planctomycetota bacterium]|jgi:1,4-alpha-glucan branching enzyme